LSGKNGLKVGFRPRKLSHYLSNTYKNSEWILTLQAKPLGCQAVRFMRKWQFHAEKAISSGFFGGLSIPPKKPYKSSV
jgi:hypothetical protein